MALRIIAYTSEVINGRIILSDSEDNTITPNDPMGLLGLNILRAEQNRVFEGFPRNGGELLGNKYTSRPIRM